MNTQQLLNQFGASVMDNIINAAIAQKRVAGGAGQQGLQRVVTDNQLQIIDSTGYAQWSWLSGRGPGKQPPLDDIINWLQQKQILQPNEKIKSAAFAIARSMGQKGSILFQNNSTTDNPIANAIQQTQINSLLDMIIDNYTAEIKTELVAGFKLPA